MKAAFRLPAMLGALVSALLLTFGCAGGGSSGTGGLRIEGTVLATQSAQPLSGYTVTIAQTGASAITDNNGAFAVDTTAVVGTMEFIIENVEGTSRTSVADVPADASVVSVKLALNTSTKDCEVSEVKIRRHGESSSNDDNSNNNNGSGSGGGSSDDDVSSDGSGGSGSDDDNSNSSDGSSGGSGSSSSGGGGSSGNGSDDDNSGSSEGSSGGSDSGSSGGSGGSSQESERIEVTALITALTSDNVTVGDTVFNVDEETDFGNRTSLAQFSVGERVEARGEIRNGVLLAERVRLKD